MVQKKVDWAQILKDHNCVDIYELVESNYKAQGSWTILAKYLHVGYDQLRSVVRRWNKDHTRKIDDVDRPRYRNCLSCGDRFEIPARGGPSYCKKDACQKSRAGKSHENNHVEMHERQKAERERERAEIAAIQEYSDRPCPFCGRMMEINRYRSCKGCVGRLPEEEIGIGYGVKAYVW